MVGQVMMPNIYGAVTGGMEDGRVRAAKNALAQAVQQGGPTSPGAMNALSALDPGRAAAMSQQAQQFDASQAQSADQFGQGMDLRTRQFDYGVERDNIGDRRAAASAGAAAGRQRDAASSAAALDWFKLKFTKDNSPRRFSTSLVFITNASLSISPKSSKLLPSNKFVLARSSSSKLCVSLSASA